MKQYKSMFRSVIVLFVLTLSLGQARAQNVSEFWISMPDSLIPHLNKNIRTELIDNKEKASEHPTLNLFQDTVRLDLLTESYLKVTLSPSSDVEIRRFTSQSDLPLFAMVRTYKAPAAESAMTIYTSDWQVVKMKVIDAHLLARPDTMSEETFNHLLSLSDPQMLEMHLSPSTEMVSLSISYPFLSQEEKAEGKRESLQTIVNLNSLAEN